MGRQDPLELGKEFHLRLAAPLSILASREHLEALKAAPSFDWLSDSTCHALELHEEVTADHLAGAGIVVVQVDPSVPQSMERIKRVHALRPDLPLIVALDDADMRLVRTLVREGVADVVELPLSPEEVLQAAIAISEVTAKADPATKQLCPLIAVTRAIGGSGATTVATHLAEGLANSDESGAGCCVIDLDIQYGRVAEVLGVAPRRSLVDLLDAGDRLDGSVVRSVAAKDENGIFVIAAPQEIIPVEAIDATRLHEVISCARREFDTVVLDMPSNLTNWALSLLAKADILVMVVEQSLPSLRQARRRLDLFRSVGLDTRNVALVVNRAQRKLFSTIGVKDVEQALGHKVVSVASLDAPTISSAQDQGVLTGRIRAKSSFVGEMAALSDNIRERLARQRQL